MPSFTENNRQCLELIRALGLPTAQCASFRIECYAGRPPTIKVEYFATPGQVETLQKILSVDVEGSAPIHPSAQ